MKHNEKNLTKLSLLVLLRKRKLSIKQFADEHGITTYSELKRLCLNIGVTAPEEHVFASAFGSIVNNPNEGVIVLDPIQIIDEKTGRSIEEPTLRPGLIDLIDYEPEPKKRRKPVKTQEETTEQQEEPSKDS